jgi:hypothetical protein
MNYSDSDMSKSTNTVVYFDWKAVIYIELSIRYNLISTCAGECDGLFHWQHTLCATFSADININYRLPIPLCFLSFDLRIMIPHVVSSNSRPLCCLSYDLRIMITPLVSSNDRPLCCRS